MGWTTLPRDLLERQFDSLGLERTFESGITDTAENAERLSDYPDYEEDARCAASLGVVTRDDGIRESTTGLLVRCKTCGKKVYAYWRKRSREWCVGTHYAPPSVGEGTVHKTTPSQRTSRSARRQESSSS